jgi:hypothetical protein
VFLGAAAFAQDVQFDYIVPNFNAYKIYQRVDYQHVQIGRNS